MKIKYTSFILILISFYATADVSDLLITEVSATSGTGVDFIEIYNNGATNVDLSNVYLTDATHESSSTYYYNIVLGNGGGGDFYDFNARFPDLAMINAGEYQTIAVNGTTIFNTAFGVNPTYELYEDNASVPNMRDATTESIASPTNSTRPSGLTSSGEVAILYTWDGNNDLVTDIDYVLWGTTNDTNEAVDKTLVEIDGPDGDVIESSYLPDVSVVSQDYISAPHGTGTSWQRIDFTEGTQNQNTGNGFGNTSDETSENLSVTFVENIVSPNGAYVPTAPNVLINEVDSLGSADFIELFGSAGSNLNDVTLVFYQGLDNTIYDLIDLSGNNIPASGYFLIGDAALPAPDITIAADSLHDNEASAVAIYFSNISNFSIGDAVTTADLIDAFVYDSGQADNATLLTLLNAGQAQIDENSNAAATTESNARCPNGGGGALNTITYMQVTPTAGSINSTCPVTPYYATADATNATTLHTSLHDIIKGHTSFPYSSGSTDTWDILSFADEDHNAAVDVNNMVAEAVWMIYKNESYTYNGGGMQSYNREHTWPQSLGFSDPDNNAPRTDAHHLMMSDTGYNSTRGNKYYDNCNPATSGSCSNASLQTTEYDGDGDGVTEGGNTGSTYPGNSNWTNGSVFEPWNFRKGDVARAMFYMAVRYDGLGEVDSTGTAEPDLRLTNDSNLIQQSSGGVAYMGILSTLLEWHTQDPVDDIERQRNEVVFSYQGNRNPFVDHPEWATCVFEDICTPVIAEDVFSNGFED